MTEVQPPPPIPQPTVEEEPPELTPPEYVAGSVKQDLATLAVAIRTNIPEDPYINRGWAVMTIDRGGHFCKWTDIKEWADMAVVGS